MANCKKTGKNDELETQLCQWIKNENENGMVLSGEDIKTKAKSLSERFGLEYEEKYTSSGIFEKKNTLLIFKTRAIVETRQ